MKTILFLRYVVILVAFFVSSSKTQVKAEPPVVCGNYELNWTMVNGLPGFCIGGFTSQDDLRQHSFDLVCTGAYCGGLINRLALNATGGDRTRISMADVTDKDIIKDDGGFYTCYSGNFSQEFVDIVNANIDRGNLACAITSATAIVNPAALLIRIATAGASCGVVQSMFTNTPTITLALRNQQGQEVCVANEKITVTEANNQVVVNDGDSYRFNLCAQLGDTQMRTACLSCSGLWTGLGCIEAEIDKTPEPDEQSGSADFTSTLVSSLSTLIVGIAGGLALLLMLFGAFTMSTATSNPERFKSGQQTFVSAVVGLFFILVSALVLQFIGVNILALPGF